MRSEEEIKKDLEEMNELEKRFKKESEEYDEETSDYVRDIFYDEKMEAFFSLKRQTLEWILNKRENPPSVLWTMERYGFFI